MATGVGDVDVEAGRQSPIADALSPGVRAEDSRLAAQDGMAARLPSLSEGPEAHGPIVYPTSFLALVICTGAVALFWTIDFFFVTAPALEAHMERTASHDDHHKWRWRKCYYADQQIRHACYTILVFFFLFVTVRGLMQVKPIGRRLQAARRGRLGSAMRYFSILVVHGPLLVFTTSSMMFWIQELVSSEECKDVQLMRSLRMFGCCSLLVAVMSCVALLWNALLRVGAVIEARRRSEKVHRRAPPGFITRIPTVPYDPELFGTEDGRRYHGECCICLGEFGAEDEIKVPHCGHAFHKDCLGRWLRKERTCALCRQDVTQASEAGAEGAGFGADVAVPGAGGPGEATPGTATAAHSGVVRAQPVVLGRSSSIHGAAASHPTHDAEVLPTHERSA
jgi:hypothetical protein